MSEHKERYERMLHKRETGADTSTLTRYPYGTTWRATSVLAFA